jgi:hypothetical protein
LWPQQHTELDAGNAPLSPAADMRFREAGGVTMTVLKTMTVPLLMSH